MKKLLAGLFLISGTAWGAGGNATSLTVSSGTYQAVSMYANDDGGARQTIILGNRTSSATVTVDDVTGIRVSLSTSALTTSNGVKIEPGQSAIPVVSTGSVAVTQSGTWTVQPGNTANTTAWKVDGSAVTQPVSGTVTVLPGASNIVVSATSTLNTSAVQSGTWNIGTLTTLTNPVTILPGVSNIVITATATIPVSGSLSVNNPSTGTINSAVPGYATYVGGNGVAGNLAGFRVDSSSYLYVNVAAGGASGGTSSTFGAAYPGPGTAAGFLNTTSGAMQAARVDASSNVIVTSGGNALPIVSTNTLNIKIADVGATGVPIVSSNTLNTSAAQSGTWNIGTVTTLTNGTVVVNAGTSAIPIVSTNTLNIKISDVGATGVPIVSSNTLNTSATQSGVWSIANSTISTNNILLVSSATTLPTSVANTGKTQAMSDNKGRMVTRPLVPWGNVLFATATLTTTTSEIVFISSGGAGVANNLIGCIGENTSATAADITFRQAGFANNAGSFKLGMSVSNVPVGFFPPTGIPQITPYLNSNWTIQGSASVTSLNISCMYWQETQ